MKTNSLKFTLMIGLALLASSCGSNMFDSAPQIRKSQASAGEAGAENAFLNLVARADSLTGDDADDIFAAAILRSQLELMTVNRASDQITTDETGRCLMLWPDGDFSGLDLGTEVSVSNGSQVVYSTASNLSSGECQQFFMDNAEVVLNQQFFDIHISFFSLSF